MNMEAMRPISEKLGNLQENIKEGIRDIPENFNKAVEGAKENAENAYSYVKEGVQDQLKQFSSPEQVATTEQGFLESNSIIAKFVFVILVVIGFLILLNLGITLIGYFTSNTNTNPLVVKGMILGNTDGQIISQDPKNSNSVLVQRSNNQATGIEFSWSLWLKVDNLSNPGSGTGSNVTYQHIFSKGGNGSFEKNGVMSVNNAPGLYLRSDTNSLHIVMDSVVSNDTNTTLDIDNIPLGKWFHVLIRMQNKVLDVYINGTIASRLIMQNVPKQNYDNIYVCKNGGFNGSLSNLQYYAKALNALDLNNIIIAGPNTSLSATSAQNLSKQSTYDYLSTLWYSSK